jgi:hypothetical protein
MKSTGFWIGRFCLAAGIAFLILVVASLLRGRALETALTDSAVWALVSSAVFTGSRYYQARKGVACALCKDTVED